MLVGEYIKHDIMHEDEDQDQEPTQVFLRVFHAKVYHYAAPDFPGGTGKFCNTTESTGNIIKQIYQVTFQS